jgi:hypothetical protein
MNQQIIQLLDLVEEYMNISNSRNLILKKAHILLTKSKLSMNTLDLSLLYDYRKLDDIKQFGILVPPSFKESADLFKKAYEYNVLLSDLSNQISNKLVCL